MQMFDSRSRLSSALIRNMNRRVENFLFKILATHERDIFWRLFSLTLLPGSALCSIIYRLDGIEKKDVRGGKKMKESEWMNLQFVCFINIFLTSNYHSIWYSRDNFQITFLRLLLTLDCSASFWWLLGIY